MQRYKKVYNVPENQDLLVRLPFSERHISPSYDEHSSEVPSAVPDRFSISKKQKNSGILCSFCVHSNLIYLQNMSGIDASCAY